MIQECRIYTPDGELKETISGEKIKTDAWEREFGGEDYTVGTSTRNRAANKKQRRVMGIHPSTVAALWRVHDFLRDTGKAHSLAEIKRGMSLNQKTRSIWEWLQRAKLAGVPIKSRIRTRNKLEYYVEVK